jgi:hypothetical protein
MTGDRTFVYTRRDIMLLILVAPTGPLLEEHHKRTSVQARNPADSQNRDPGNWLNDRRRELDEEGWTFTGEVEGWWWPPKPSHPFGGTLEHV